MNWRNWSVIYAKVLRLFSEMKDLGSRENSLTSFSDVKSLANKFISIGNKFALVKTGYSDIDEVVAKIGDDMKKIGNQMSGLSAGDLSGVSNLTDLTDELESDSEDLTDVFESSPVSDLESDFDDAVYDLSAYISLQIK